MCYRTHVHRSTTVFLLLPLGLAHAAPAKAHAPEVDFALTSITSGYSTDQLATAMGRAKPALAACYGAQRAKQPDLAGTLHLYFRIAETGSATEALAGGFDEAVEQCIVGAIGKVAFAKPAKPIQVEYELHLGHPTSPSVDTRLPDVSNGYARKTVVDIVGHARPAVLDCYKARLPGGGGSGAVSLIFEIAGDGTVQQHKRDAIALGDDRELSGCISDVISKLAFTAPATAPVVVHDILLFSR